MNFTHLIYVIARELNCHSKNNKRQVWRKLSPAAQKRGFACGIIEKREGDPARLSDFRKWGSVNFPASLLGVPKKRRSIFWGEFEGGAERM